jgi:hypothetical protein
MWNADSRKDIVRKKLSKLRSVAEFKGIDQFEKRWDKVVAFDRSPFKLFTLRFSNKSVQAPSCERPKTTQRNLFLSFESNNCFPITV